ncbi:MAG: right-handed parallel beta-helix repeat-containing protein [Chthoniobacteraceae bacterium]
MKSLYSLVVASLLLFAATHAQAQATRTWVSGVGDDANPGSRTAPCKTFAGVISKTAPSGVINVLDPGGFGAVTITKSITIDAGYSIGSVLVSGTNGIAISAAATDTVVLRNLDLQGLGTSLCGIKIITAGTVLIENCEINGFTTGISVLTDANVVIRNCVIRNNTSTADSANGAAGVLVNSPKAEVKVLSTTINSNIMGISVAGGADVWVGTSFILDNSSAGLKIKGQSTLVSMQSNHVIGNSPNGSFNKLIDPQ